MWSRSSTAAAAALAVAAACHTTTRYQDTKLGDSTLRPRPGEQRAAAPAIAVGDGGRLRFVEPLVCKNDVVVARETYDVTRKEANIATFIIGLVVVSAGGITALSGGLSDDGDVALYIGLGAIAAGLPFTIGPFVGNRTTRTFSSADTITRGKKNVACGERALDADRATIVSDAQVVAGTVDADGFFSVPVFSFVDAFALDEISGVPIEATVWRGHSEPLTLKAVLAPSDLAPARQVFFAGAGIDGRVEPLRKVSSPAARELRVVRTLTSEGHAVRFSATFVNEGIGDAWGVRGVLSSTNPELDGRVLYVGHLAAKDSVTRELTVPLSRSDVDLGGARISLFVRDAHRTSSSRPLEHEGPILNDT